jgi:GxxExxY protein
VDGEVERILRLSMGLSVRQKMQLIQALAGGVSDELGHRKRDQVFKPQRVALPTDQLTYNIVGNAMAVHTAKGSGYRENTYQKDLETHFDQSTLPFVAQKLLDVFDSVDSRRLIGYYIPDFIVDNRVIVEIKALHGLDNSHIAQVIGYLAVTGCEVGLLINFGQRSLEWKRVLPPQRIQDHKVNRQWLFVPEWLQEK